LRSPLARVRTPSSLVSERERASPERVIKRERVRKREREKKRERDSIYF
jgi:hypothetical protein